jgi:hypothetical protein
LGTFTNSPLSQTQFGADALDAPSESRRSAQIDVGVVGPLAHGFDERPVLVGVFAATTSACELFDEVVEFAGTDGVTAGPPPPLVEGADLPSYGGDSVRPVRESDADEMSM